MRAATGSEGLAASLGRLHDALSELQMALGDRPTDGDARPVDAFTEAADEMLDGVAEAMAALELGEGPEEAAGLGRALGVCQERVNRIAEQFAVVTGFTPVAQLRRFAREQGGEWPDWFRTIQVTLERLRQLLREASDALLGCWRDFAERAGTVTVSVRAGGK